MTPLQETQLVLYRLIQLLEKKELTPDEQKKVQEAKYILTKHSDMQGVLRENKPNV